MRKVAVVTATRAEYGLLKNILYKIVEDSDLKLQLIVTGTHLSKDYGYSLEEIVADKFPIEEKVSILLDSNTGQETAKSMGIAMLSFSSLFERISPDILLILGDRYEIFAAAATAMVMNIPIAHISGGEITEGAFDNQIRHSITKMSHIHFPANIEYAKNIGKMGEETWRIFNVGDPGIENIKLLDFISKDQLKMELGTEVDEDTLLVTYHPVTLEMEKLAQQVESLIDALRILDKKMIITYPNADQGGKYVIERLKAFASENSKVYLFKSLGSIRYLSVMKYCGAVVGNSSSGIVEAPYLKVPVVNIGDRQKGRIIADNIICCRNSTHEIVESINKALSYEFRNNMKNVRSLYGEGNTSEEITKILKSIEINERLIKKKLVWS